MVVPFDSCTRQPSGMAGRMMENAFKSLHPMPLIYLLWRSSPVAARSAHRRAYPLVPHRRRLPVCRKNTAGSARMRRVSACMQSTVVPVTPTCQWAAGLFCRMKAFTIRDTNAPPIVMSKSGTNFLSESIASRVRSTAAIKRLPFMFAIVSVSPATFGNSASLLISASKQASCRSNPAIISMFLPIASSASRLMASALSSADGSDTSMMRCLPVHSATAFIGSSICTLMCTGAR